MNNDHYIYILECSDKTYYTGYTTNIDRRFKQHAEGKASKYTRGRLPVKLVYSEKLKNRSIGLKREYEIKSLTRKQKEILIREGEKYLYTKEF